jgi:hypothetical protein
MPRDQKINRRQIIRNGTQTLSTAALFGWLGSSAVGAAPESDELIQGIGTIRTGASFGLRSDRSASANRKSLQSAFDWATDIGGLILIEPTEKPYPVESGLVLRQNVSMIGAQSAVPRSTSHSKRRHPVGSVFCIESEDKPFITVESSTQLRGLQFWYPNQTRTDPAKIVEYPATIRTDPTKSVFGVSLVDLTFLGEFITFDFNSSKTEKGQTISELLRVEHCFGYPLSGRFIEIDRCYDIPRVLHCHVNPAIRRLAEGDNSREIIDSVVRRKTFSFKIEHTDNAQLIDLFSFGTYGGIRLGSETYGQLTNFNFDCVAVGIHKTGSNQFNRNWQIAQGSIIANAATSVAENHPIVLDGAGHTSLSTVESFCGKNGDISSPSVTLDGREVTCSQDYLLIKGKEPLTASLFGCRMANYLADDPITVKNPNASVATFGCFARHATQTQAFPYSMKYRYDV